MGHENIWVHRRGFVLRDFAQVLRQQPPSRMRRREISRRFVRAGASKDTYEKGARRCGRRGGLGFSLKDTFSCKSFPK